MEGQAQQQIGSGQEKSTSFTIGVSSSQTQEPGGGQTKTPRAPTAQQIEEKRKNEFFQVDKAGEKSKRSRTEFAEKLRKEKREEHMRQKRQNLGGSTSAQASASAWQPVTEQQMEDDVEGQVITRAKLIVVSIEEALASLQQSTLQEFIMKTAPGHIGFKLEEFPTIANLVMSGQDDSQRFLGCHALRKLLSRKENPPYQQTVDANLVPALVAYTAREDFEKLQLEAAWCLTNIASDTEVPGLVQVLINAQILPALKNLLYNKQTSLDVLEQVIWCYGNISGESIILRDLILAEQVVEPIAAALDNTQAGSSAMRNLAWCLSNFMKGDEPPHFPHVVPGIPALVRALQRTDVDEVINDIVWGLSHFTASAEVDKMRCVIASGAIPRIVQLLDHSKVQISIPSLRIIGNIVASESDIFQAAIQAGILPIFGKLVDHPKQIMRKEVIWSLANITADSPEMVQECVNNGIVKSLILHMQHDVDAVRREAVWALTNALCKGEPATVQQIIALGYFTASNYALELADTTILYVALEGITYALKAGLQLPPVQGENPFVLAVENCGLLDKIETLQEHANEKIYKKCSEILNVYFLGDDDDEHLPLVNEDNNQGSGGDLGGPSYQDLFNV